MPAAYIDPDELLTDQHRLDVAPALGAAIDRWREPISGLDVADPTLENEPPTGESDKSLDEEAKTSNQLRRNLQQRRP